MQTHTEVERVAQHIAHAMQHAAARDVSQLSHVQKLVRSLLLEELERYRAAGRFPRNPDFAERTPYFIDAEGTRCAMAHLMEVGGQGELVQHIATSRNNARVKELADESQLLAWLDSAGLSVEEAAAIQPSYSCGARSECVCGGSFSYIDHPLPAKGVLEAVVQTGGRTAIVDATYGETLGIAKGATITLRNQHQTGARVLAPVDAASAADAGTGLGAVAVDADGTYHCSSQGVSESPNLSKSDFASAVTSSNCRQTLGTIDSRWNQSCSSNLGPEPKGCSVAGGEASIGVLIAVVTALVARRIL